MQVDQAGDDAGGGRRARWRQPGLALAGLHLAALTSLAIARPYFDPLAKGADFFVTHGATSLDVLVFALGLVVVPPVLLLLAEWLVGIVSTPAREVLHLVFVTALVALIVWQAINEGGTTLGASKVIGLALLAGAVAAAAYWRLAVVRSWLTLLSPAPIVVLALFLAFSPVRALAFGGHGHEPVGASGAKAPVVWVMLDELPVASLMDAHERVDAARYPAFAALARRSTWYRNTATVADFTQLAVPTELTGRTVKEDELQVAAEHPDSLFTLVGKDYRVDATEIATHLCDEAACPVQLRPPGQDRIRAMFGAAFRTIPVFPSWVRRRLADWVTPSGSGPDAWLHEQPEESVDRLSERPKLGAFGVFLESLRASDGKTLNYLHVGLPHRPFNFLPSGQSYQGTRRYKDNDYRELPRDPVAATIDQQRHLAQLALTDRLLGRLIARLKRLGVYDRALLVVTADHGAAFKPGADQRIVRAGNVEEIAFVPFFVKAPGQRRGRIVDAPLQTNDVLPTVADALGVRVPWKTDGRPARTVGDRRTLTMYRRTGGGQVTISRAELERRQRAALRRKLARLGSGRRSIYGFGPHRWLMGRRVADLRLLPRGRLSVALDGPERYRALDPTAPVVPADIGGEVRGGTPRSRRIAVAVNGRVAATGWTLRRGRSELFTALVPPTALRKGANRVEVFAVTGRGRQLRLTRLSPAT